MASLSFHIHKSMGGAVKGYFCRRRWVIPLQDVRHRHHSALSSTFRRACGKFMKMDGKEGLSAFSRRISVIRNDVKEEEKPWRESGSVLLVAPMKNAITSASELGYLVMERSKGSGFAPGVTVFPGGVVAEVDSSMKWVELYEGVGQDLNALRFLDPGAYHPSIYSEDDRADGQDHLPKIVTLRLAAIRETFEECGILLCQRKGSKQKTESSLYQFPELSDKKVIQEWQTRVRTNSTQFLSLCEKLGCLPDLSALKDWNNWLTPTIFKPKARFDTLFYMVLLPKILPVSYDSHEVASAQWASPTSLIQQHVNGSIKLMPPQLYELSRLEPLKSVSELESRIRHRQKLGIARHFPVIEQASDGMVFLLPGDDRYPTNPDFITEGKPPKVEQTLEELQKSSKSFHRATFAKSGGYQTIITVEKYGHKY